MASSSPPPPNDVDGVVRVAGYTGLRRIGSGGFSAVYRATQSTMGRDVAIKVLSADLSSESDRRTFERECRAMGLLSRHPNIVTVYNEAFTDDGRPCIVMELYDGNYRERLDQSGPLTIPQLLSLGIKMAGALQVAHGAGVLHRDLKPHNIFLSDYGEPALGDFGISTLDDERSVSAQSGLSVAYAAPEVLEDSVATTRADIYSLAATMFHLADGMAPFTSKQMRATVKRILTEDAPPLRRSDAPDALSDVLRRALAKEPVQRFVSAGAFADALQGVQAELGLDRTEIPMRRPDGAPHGRPAPTSTRAPSPSARVEGSEHTRTVSRPPRAEPTADRARTAPPGPHRAPEPAAERPGRGFPTDQSESAGEHTIRRARHAAPAVEPQREAAPHEPSVGRRRMALALSGIVVVAVGVLGFSLARGGRSETAATTTAVTIAGDPDDDVFYEVVGPPSDVVVTGDEEQVTVSFAAIEGATRYQAESVAPSPNVGATADGESNVLTADVSIDDAPCWRVRTFGGGGRVSDFGTIVCTE